MAVKVCWWRYAVGASTPRETPVEIDNDSGTIGATTPSPVSAPNENPVMMPSEGSEQDENSDDDDNGFPSTSLVLRSLVLPARSEDRFVGQNEIDNSEDWSDDEKDDNDVEE